MSQAQSDVMGAIRGYVAEDLLRGDDRGLNAETPLLELGIIDSLSMASLVQFLEGHFSVKVDEAAIVPTNFQNLTAITAMVERLLAKK